MCSLTIVPCGKSADVDVTGSCSSHARMSGNCEVSDDAGMAYSKNLLLRNLLPSF